MTYTIKLDHFEGPFDLLLFFIERDELDIYDIPISEITNDFLDYLKEMEQLNIDLASEFILVASQLMKIKAKMLLPRKEVDEMGEEIDPRKELVDRLIEYKKYKSILSEFEARELDRSKRLPRTYAQSELNEFIERAHRESEIESINLYKIMNTFQKLMLDLKEKERKAIHRIYRYNYTIQEESKRILSTLEQKSKIYFSDLFSVCENRIHAIITFLALLEMANQWKITLEDNEGINNILVEARPCEEEAE